MGPSFRDVAKKYQGVAGTEAKLITKVKQGGKGVWGPVPMPPATNVPDDDLNTIVAWILSLSSR